MSLDSFAAKIGMRSAPFGAIVNLVNRASIDACSLCDELASFDMVCMDTFSREVLFLLFVEK